MGGLQSSSVTSVPQKLLKDHKRSQEEWPHGVTPSMWTETSKSIRLLCCNPMHNQANAGSQVCHVKRRRIFVLWASSFLCVCVCVSLMFIYLRQNPTGFQKASLKKNNKALILIMTITRSGAYLSFSDTECYDICIIS